MSSWLVQLHFWIIMETSPTRPGPPAWNPQQAPGVQMSSTFCILHCGEVPQESRNQSKGCLTGCFWEPSGLLCTRKRGSAPLTAQAGIRARATIKDPVRTIHWSPGTQSYPSPSCTPHW